MFIMFFILGFIREKNIYPQKIKIKLSYYKILKLQTILIFSKKKYIKFFATIWRTNYSYKALYKLNVYLYAYTRVIRFYILDTIKTRFICGHGYVLL